MSLDVRAFRLAAMAVLCGWSLATVTGCRTAPSNVKGQTEPRRTPSRFDLPPHDFIFVGMDTETLTRLVGQPNEIEDAGHAQEWYYDFGVVVIEGGRVAFNYPESRVHGSPLPTVPTDAPPDGSPPDEPEQFQ